tara:strand:- start:3175 stop:3789 length:615 start_codon:yes stop_codon:yes gene_type:complete
MPSTNKRVAWEKWDEDVLDQEIIEDTVNEFGEYEEDASLAEDALLFLEKIPKLVTTPLGMFQLYDKMSVMNQYECWMGYTNFDITSKVKTIIEKTQGVELLTIISRYRFFVGIGKLFDFSDVRLSIEESLCGAKFELDDETKETVKVVKDALSSDRYWAIFVSANGELSYSSTNDDNDEGYLETLMSYEKQKKKSGGKIIQNEQ